MSEERYKAVNLWSREIALHHRSDVRDAVFSTLQTPFPLIDRTQPYRVLGDPSVHGGHQPFFVPEANRAAPAFIDLRRFAGKFQSLNSESFWADILARTHWQQIAVGELPRDEETLAKAIAFGNQNNFERWLVFLAGGIVFGAEDLPFVVDRYYDMHRAFLAAHAAVADFRTPAASADELWERSAAVLGNSVQKGLGIKNMGSAQEGCPAPALTQAIMGEFGDYMILHWDAFFTAVENKNI